MIPIIMKIAANPNIGIVVAKIIINLLLSLIVLFYVVSPFLFWYKLPFELNTYVETS
jgi:hypothetical protein